MHDEADSTLSHVEIKEASRLEVSEMLNIYDRQEQTVFDDFVTILRPMQRMRKDLLV